MACERTFPDTFIDEDPQKALEELNGALEESSDNAEWLCQRAYAHILLKNYSRAVDDAKKAQQLQPGLALAFLRTGIAEYHLNNCNSAHEAFLEGQKLDGSNDAFQTWIERCAELLQQETQNEATNTHAAATPPVKRDWYQTESQVIVTIMLKNAKNEDVNVRFQENECWASLKLASGEDYCLKLCLLHPVLPEHCSYRILSTKIEIKMKKAEAIRWEKLEGEGTQPSIKHFTPNQYPSSCHYTRNWDQLVGAIKEEEKNEKLEGDAALNKLFQQIYTDGSDEVKRAMNKSFMESGGTVLSTNWTDVGKRTVEISPPDDMEFKKY